MSCIVHRRPIVDVDLVEQAEYIARDNLGEHRDHRRVSRLSEIVSGFREFGRPGGQVPELRPEDPDRELHRFAFGAESYQKRGIRRYEYSQVASHPDYVRLYQEGYRPGEKPRSQAEIKP